MLLYSLLLSIALSCCSAQGDHHDNAPQAMTVGAAQSHDDHHQPNAAPKLLELVDEQNDQWGAQVLKLLTQLVQVQKEVAKKQVEVVQLLGSLQTQGSQQIQDLQTLARQQSLLVENHQALLLQTSRISTHLQDLAKKPAAAAPGQ